MEADGDPDSHRLRVLHDDEVNELRAAHGANLRQILIATGLSPHAALPRVLNCGGRGLCATCGVAIEDGEPAPRHWHDRLGDRYGYPRLACQIRVNGEMTIRLLADKRIWGTRRVR